MIHRTLVTECKVTESEINMEMLLVFGLVLVNNERSVRFSLFFELEIERTAS